MRVVYQPVTSLAEMQEHKLDLLCGPTAETLKTRQLASFSIPIYVSGLGALVRRDASPALLRVLNGQAPHTGPTWRATANAGLSSHVLAVLGGSDTEDRIRRRIASSGVIVKVVAVQSFMQGMQMIDQRQADAFFADRASLDTYVTQTDSADRLLVIDRRFTLEPIALAMQRGDEDFRLLVDTALSKLYRSGEYAPVYTRYFGAPSATAQMLFQAYGLP
jgi:polar amino acid transport system substrate-binding protein